MESSSDDQKEADHQENPEKPHHQEEDSDQENSQEPEKAIGKRPFEESSKVRDDNERKSHRMIDAEEPNPDLLPPDIDILNALRDYLVKNKKHYPSAADNYVLIEFVRSCIGGNVRPESVIERIETLHQSCRDALRIEGTGSLQNTSRTINLSPELFIACMEVWGDFSGFSRSTEPIQETKNSADGDEEDDDEDGEDDDEVDEPERTLSIPEDNVILQSMISYQEANQVYPSETGMSDFVKNWLHFYGDPRLIDQRIELLSEDYVNEQSRRTQDGDSGTVADIERLRLSQRIWGNVGDISSGNTTSEDETNGSSASSIGKENRDPNNGGDRSQSNFTEEETSGNTAGSGDEESGQEGNRIPGEDADKNPKDPGKPRLYLPRI